MRKCDFLCRKLFTKFLFLDVLQQIVCFYGSLGLKKTWSAISQFPGMILLSPVTFYTYSGITIKPSAEAECNNIDRKLDLHLTIRNNRQIGVSKLFTWINFFMNLGGMLIYINFFAVQLTSSQCRFKDLTCKKNILFLLNISFTSYKQPIWISNFCNKFLFTYLLC